LSRPRPGQSQEWFFLAYGVAHGVHHGTDRFDFADSHFRLSRFASLFDWQAKLTDPVAFLSFLKYRGVRKGRHPALLTLTRLGQAADEMLRIEAEPFTATGTELERWWGALPERTRRVLVPVLDAVRHAVDASPFQPEPLDIPCPILLNRPDLLFGLQAFPAWVLLLESLFPKAQFIATLVGFGAGRLSARTPGASTTGSGQRDAAPTDPPAESHPGRDRAHRRGRNPPEPGAHETEPAFQGTRAKGGAHPG
jgi:hypothetical protein